MKIHRNVASLLKQVGASLVRHSKHYIFELPNGKRLTVSSTPSDRYAVKNQEREIKQAGGIVESVTKNSERVQKTGRTDEQGRRVTREWLNVDHSPIPAAPSLSSQLSATGITERALRQQVETLNSEMKIKNATILFQEDRIHRLIALMENWTCRCWPCRLCRFFGGKSKPLT